MPVTTAAAGPAISGLLARVYRDIVANRTSLPSMPDVAVRLRAAMARDTITTAGIARVLQADPSTCAYLLRIANSALYRGACTTTTIEGAVRRLGHETTRNIVTSHALRAMFATRSKPLARAMRDLWHRSTRLAAFSAILARHTGVASPDRAMLAGLMQDIGCLPLIGALDRGRTAVDDPAQITRSLDAYCARVGVLLLESWEFDAGFIEVARSRHDWWRDPPDGPDLADVVLIARMHACAGSDSVDGIPAIQELPAFGRLDLGEVTADQHLRLLLESEADARSLMRTLGV